MVELHDPGLWPVLFLGAFGFLGWLASIFGSLASFFAKTAVVILKVLALVVPYIVTLGKALWAGVNFVGRVAFDFGRAVVRGVRWLVREGIPRVIDALEAAFKRLDKLAERFLKPVADFLKKVNGWIDYVYQHVVEPILLWFDFSTLILRLLEKLGVEWAGRLAASIERLRTEIYNRFEQVRHYVNEVTRYVNDLLDPSGLIKRRLLRLSIFRDVGAIWNILVNTGLLNNVREHSRDLAERFPKGSIETAVSEYRQDKITRLPEVQRAVAFYRDAFLQKR